MADILSRETIRLQASAVDKEDAIRQAGELLVKAGCVKPDYVKGMLEREKTMSTFVGEWRFDPAWGNLTTWSWSIAPVFPFYRCRMAWNGSRA